MLTIRVVAMDDAFFAQDDWRLSQKLTLSYGVRQEFQTHLREKLNLAPHIDIAWAPTKKGTLRTGVGIFYNRFDTGITLDTVRYDGAHRRAYVIQSPQFFPLQLASSALPPELERNPRADLNLATRSRRFSDSAELWRVDETVRCSEIRVVERVKELGSKLELQSFGDSKLADHRQV